MLFLSASYAKLKEHDSVRGVLNTLIPAIVGLLIAACWTIGRDSLCHAAGAGIFIVSLVALIKYRVNPALLIGAAAVVGILLKL